MKMFVRGALAVMAICLLASCGGASGEKNSGAPPQGGGADRQPPQMPEEAFTACEGKSAGDACTVQRENVAEEGTCAAAPEGEGDARLSCRPAGRGGPPPKDEGQQPPQQ
jgi:hypothetical protein